MPLACSRRHFGGSEPMHRARQFSQLFLGCIFKERPAQMDMEKPPAWFHWSFLFLVNLAALSVASCLQKIELWYPRFGLQAIDCDLGCLIYATAARQWRIVEIQLLASVGWQWGCQPFSCPCSQNVMTCLSNESIPAIPSWNSKHPINTRSLRFLRATVCSTSPALWLHQLHHACKR